MSIGSAFSLMYASAAMHFSSIVRPYTMLTHSFHPQHVLRHSWQVVHIQHLCQQLCLLEPPAGKTGRLPSLPPTGLTTLEIAVSLRFFPPWRQCYSAPSRLAHRKRHLPSRYPEAETRSCSWSAQIENCAVRSPGQAQMILVPSARSTSAATDPMLLAIENEGQLQAPI
ncbi:hypothetical protein K458DRAFT_62925 [Lentithecium fluviatile CBS 122367]|uniref:Uncharacterized protein n=1 Tax=Lentithecium fluviatile CBS 122367 TaxID=1168545 RepID=A0A6G1JJX4_9PLEO|nr:hypothetical protein K458DRAFT_62925 [Lentithecium fluviatile CBS 122367]